METRKITINASNEVELKTKRIMFNRPKDFCFVCLFPHFHFKSVNFVTIVYYVYISRGLGKLQIEHLIETRRNRLAYFGKRPQSKNDFSLSIERNNCLEIQMTFTGSSCKKDHWKTRE